VGQKVPKRGFPTRKEPFPFPQDVSRKGKNPKKGWLEEITCENKKGLEKGSQNPPTPRR